MNIIYHAKVKILELNKEKFTTELKKQKDQI